MKSKETENNIKEYITHISISGRKTKRYKDFCLSCNKDKGYIRKGRLFKECHSCNSNRQAEVGRTHNGKQDQVIENNRKIRSNQKIIHSSQTKKKISIANKISWKLKHGETVSINHKLIRTAFSKLLSRYAKKRSLSPRQSKSKFDCLGYSPLELQLHLESRFQPGMTWDNYGQWHIDHIRPDSSFIYGSFEDENFKLSWALTNLQPLWAKDNLSKGAKYVL